MITPNDFSGSDSDRIEQAIHAAVQNGSFRMMIPQHNNAQNRNVWLIDRAILIPSNFTLLLQNATIELAPGVKDNLIRNAAAGKKDADPDRNIEILGLGYTTNVLCGGHSSHFDPPGDRSGWRTIGILLQNVDGAILRNFTMRETQAWAISLENGVQHATLANIHFENSNSIPNQDGIDIRKGCHDILIENITGYTGDDVIALTGLMRTPEQEKERQRPPMQIGGSTPTGNDDIYNITIQNVMAKCVGGHGIIRLLNHDGIKLHDITIRNVWNTATPSDKSVYSCIRIGDRNYSSIRLANEDELYNISIDGLHWSGQRAIRYSAPHGYIDARNVSPVDDFKFDPILVPKPQNVEMFKGVFFAPSPYVERNWISFKRDRKIKAEGYRLVVSPESVTVYASDDAGEFYAMQTLRQLANEKRPYDNCDDYVGGEGGLPLILPCCQIEDAPAFHWRGVHLDVCRHFFGKETVKDLLDQMAYHKLNILHWHLTEDQGWRIEIKKYPLLLKYGAVRHGTQRRFARNENDISNETYGPFFYSQDDIREIVEYAKQRQIEIVPEIDLPGHIRSALAAYPEFSCIGKSLEREPRHSWGIEEDVLCVGNEKAIQFVKDVVDEVCALFPSKYFHIGGDECPTTRWKSCKKCQAKAKEMGLESVDQLQGWFTEMLVNHLAEHGKIAIGWDELLQYKIPKNACIMSWRDRNGAIQGAKTGHEVILTPQNPLYFNRSAGLEDDPFEGRARNTFYSLEMVYAFRIFEGIATKDQKRVKGAQCCLWSEIISNQAELEWKLWPRGAALAEVLWSDPEIRDFEEFKSRISSHRKRLIHLGINSAPIE